MLRARASSAALHCVIEQETLMSALYWFNPGSTEKNVDWEVKNQIKQTNCTSFGLYEQLRRHFLLN